MTILSHSKTINRIVEDFLKTNEFEIKPLAGGDINQAYAVKRKGDIFFLKLNDAKKFPQMMEKEADGLKALAKHSQFKIPQVLSGGTQENIQYLFLEYIQSGRGRSNFWTDFGTKLANMHRVSDPHFGWPTANYMGSIRQENTRCHSWQEFFANYRVLPLSQMLFRAGAFSSRDVDQAEKLCSRLEALFPHESPAFIHGDLWSGNFMIDNAGLAVLIDPAVSFSHREMDLGMTQLFGGFPEDFYRSYEDTYPLEKNWKQRLPLAQLYPLLIHAVLFGGSYVRRCQSIMARF